MVSCDCDPVNNSNSNTFCGYGTKTHTFGVIEVILSSSSVEVLVQHLLYHTQNLSPTHANTSCYATSLPPHTPTTTTTPTHVHSDTNECKRILKEDFDINASDTDCEAVKRMCEAVSTRAARLAGTGIVALVRKIKKLEKCTVAVDGSLYKLHPMFRGRCGCVVGSVGS